MEDYNIELFFGRTPLESRRSRILRGHYRLRTVRHLCLAANALPSTLYGLSWRDGPEEFNIVNLSGCFKFLYRPILVVCSNRMDFKAVCLSLGHSLLFYQFTVQVQFSNHGKMNQGIFIPSFILSASSLLSNPFMLDDMIERLYKSTTVQSWWTVHFGRNER